MRPDKNLPSINDVDQIWIDWHKNLVTSIGRSQANLYWSKYYNIVKPDKATTNYLIDYAEKQGIKIDRTALQSLGNVFSGIGDFAAGAFGVIKYTGIALLVIVVGGIALVVYNVAKNPNKTIDIAVRR